LIDTGEPAPDIEEREVDVLEKRARKRKRRPPKADFEPFSSP